MSTALNDCMIASLNNGLYHLSPSVSNEIMLYVVKLIKKTYLVCCCLGNVHEHAAELEQSLEHIRTGISGSSLSKHLKFYRLNNHIKVQLITQTKSTNCTVLWKFSAKCQSRRRSVILLAQFNDKILKKLIKLHSSITFSCFPLFYHSPIEA